MSLSVYKCLCIYIPFYPINYDILPIINPLFWVNCVFTAVTLLYYHLTRVPVDTVHCNNSSLRSYTHTPPLQTGRSPVFFSRLTDHQDSFPCKTSAAAGIYPNCTAADIWIILLYSHTPHSLSYALTLFSHTDTLSSSFIHSISTHTLSFLRYW